jgi:hypothetical protein
LAATSRLSSAQRVSNGSATAVQGVVEPMAGIEPNSLLAT